LLVCQYFEVMKSLTIALIVAPAALCVSLTRAAAGQPARNTLNGIYTEPQAKRGQAVYEEQCQSCHGPDLKGADQAPALVGAEFNSEWNDFPVSDLFDRVRLTMPADKPGTLKPEQAADVLAFLLSKDGFPAGDAELAPQADALKDLKFVTK
jgi:mono/diheme cytochrome c family protein